jgi:dimethylhistidine N-methyltransferase
VPRRIPSKYLYDAKGSELFEQICDLDEYYLTRTETAILREHAADMASLFGVGAVLVEYGSGGSTKTRVLLDRMRDLSAYVPIDISREHLTQAAATLRERYPSLPIHPVCADYTADYELPPLVPAGRRVIFFSGSTIGNLTRPEADAFLAHAASVGGEGAGLLIGVDLHKDSQRLEAAYDDSEGVSARFALNLLDRINRELGANFRRERFRYVARYDTDEMRIEMALVSDCDQDVVIGERRFEFAAGEEILTEYSHKYTLESFAEIARSAGLSVTRVWMDEERLFSIQYLTVG